MKNLRNKFIDYNAPSEIYLNLHPGLREQLTKQAKESWKPGDGCPECVWLPYGMYCDSCAPREERKSFIFMAVVTIICFSILGVMMVTFN